MIYTYLGTPGAGKSLHVAKDIRDHLKYGALVISNFPVNLEYMKMKKESKFIYMTNKELIKPEAPGRIESLCIDYRQNVSKRCKILLVLDECQLLFDSRAWDAPGRMEWLAFFTLHRHVMLNDNGQDGTILLVTQNEKALDKRLLPLAEYYVQHRNLRYGSMGEFLLSMLFGFNLFISKTMWRPGREKIEVKVVLGNRKLFRLYDTTMAFTTADQAGGEYLEPPA